MNCHQFIKNTFLKLTSKTYPYGFEDNLLSEQKSLFPELERDKFDNYFFKIGNSKTVFACHLDTACKEHTIVNHVITDNIVKTDGTTILGADDKAGVTLLLWLIKNNIPGLYYFFIGEEVGCIGSSKASTLSIFKDYDRIISFDRRGTESVITHQSSTRTCSDQFAIALVKELNDLPKIGLRYETDDTGVYTDSAEFVSVIPECTNISVGYYNEHTVKESQDLNHLVRLATSIININWENLPTVRDTKDIEYKEYWSDKYERSYDITSSDHNFKSKKRGSRRGQRGSSKTQKRGRNYIDLGGGDYEEIFIPQKNEVVNDLNRCTKRDSRDREEIKVIGTTKTYESFTQKLIKDRDLSREELSKLKYMYFDMTIPEDISEYDHLSSSI